MPPKNQVVGFIIFEKELQNFKERTVRHHINETKLLPYLKISKKIIIRDEDLSGFIESQLKNKLLKE